MGLNQAITMTRPRGTIVMKSTVHSDVCFDAAAVIVNEIRLVGSRCGRFEPALELLKERRVDVRPLISARFPLREAIQAFTAVSKPGTLKVLLSPA